MYEYMYLHVCMYKHTGKIEKLIIRQPPIGEKDDYDSENSWISDGLPISTHGDTLQHM